jgi:hypothetical protein
MTCSDHKRPVARPRGLWATVMWLCKWGREFNIFLYCWVHGFDVCSLIEKPTAPYLRTRQGTHQRLFIVMPRPPRGHTGPAVGPAFFTVPPCAHVPCRAMCAPTQIFSIASAVEKLTARVRGARVSATTLLEHGATEADCAALSLLRHRPRVAVRTPERCNIILATPRRADQLPAKPTRRPAD